jgi:hypothetical protein
MPSRKLSGSRFKGLLGRDVGYFKENNIFAIIVPLMFLHTVTAMIPDLTD